ncbi:hypothetical protein CgunFtcFv8_009197 [Champsocephalus gunnari]|uniref:Uncharacterized protein n=1 Tax=Champsocephalus gunnari TaxID=52237 RepID=A0AAN8H134_CHAGU|nr:hypothetical protein CgunFtcFv8_009197 [Champsocephalus gunnari]
MVTHASVGSRGSSSSCRNYWNGTLLSVELLQKAEPQSGTGSAPEAWCRAAPLPVATRTPKPGMASGSWLLQGGGQHGVLVATGGGQPGQGGSTGSWLLQGGGQHGTHCVRQTAGALMCQRTEGVS